MRLEREEQNIDTERRKQSSNVGVGDDVIAHDAGFERRFETMRKIVESGQQDEAFFLCDQDRIVQNFEFWHQKLANVTPYFDTGCNSSAMVLSTLAQLGAKFSCQNKLQLEQLSKIGVPAKDIFFGSSVKVASHLRYANSFGVNIMAFETAAEITKIKKNSPNARLIYRLNFPGTNNQNFSIPAMSELLTAATNADLKVVGVSIHLTETGSIPFQKSVSLSRLIFALGKSLGHDLSLLDLGELAPDLQNLPDFEQFAKTVESFVSTQFRSLDNYSDLKVFAHPSSFIVDSAFSLAAKVIGKRVGKTGSNVSYVVNDGIFGAFGRLLTDDDIILEPKPLNRMPTKQIPTSGNVCDVFGPSGHDMDQLCYGQIMSDLEIGDWMVFDNMGAFAMTQWDENYSVGDRHNSASPNGALLVAENFWFYSRAVAGKSSIDDVDIVDNVVVGINDVNDDDDFVCAFYELPDIDQHDEEKFFTLLR